MKINLVFLALFAFNNLHAFELTPFWSSELKKKVTLSCSYDDQEICQEICGKDDICQLDEGPCWNCIGSSFTISSIFKLLGKDIVVGNELAPYETMDILKKGQFVTVGSKSVFDLAHRYGDRVVAERFRSVCPNGKSAVLILKTKRGTRHLEKIHAISCGHELYEVSYNPDVVFNSPESVVRNPDLY